MPNTFSLKNWQRGRRQCHVDPRQLEATLLAALPLQLFRAACTASCFNTGGSAAAPRLAPLAGGLLQVRWPRCRRALGAMCLRPTACAAHWLQGTAAAAAAAAAAACLPPLLKSPSCSPHVAAARAMALQSSSDWIFGFGRWVDQCLNGLFTALPAAAAFCLFAMQQPTRICNRPILSLQLDPQSGLRVFRHRSALLHQGLSACLLSRVRSSGRAWHGSWGGVERGLGWAAKPLLNLLLNLPLACHACRSTDHRGVPEAPGRTVTLEPAAGSVVVSLGGAAVGRSVKPQVPVRPS